MSWIDAHCHVGHGIMNGQGEDDLVRQMDRLGITKAIIAPWDQAIAVHNREGNDYVAQLVKKHPGRFDAFCTVNPWFGQDALSELDRAVGTGLKGLKLHPMYQGFVLTDPFMIPIIERAVAYQLPIYIATGTPVSSLPMQLAHIAEQYPETVFIQGHFGFPDFWIDALPSALRTPNIYIDTAYNSISTIEKSVEIFGADRVIFSSDAPYLSLENETKKLLSCKLTDEQRKKVCHDNMAAIMERVGA